MARCLVLLAEHSGDNRLQSLEQVRLTGRILAHIKLAGDFAHSIAVIDSLGVDTKVNRFLRGQQEVHLLRDTRPILIGADITTILEVFRAISICNKLKSRYAVPQEVSK